MTDDNYTLLNVECIDTSKSSHPISTGIGFFDHMLDQLNSHAQVGVAITVKKTSVDNISSDDHGNISAGSATDEHAFQVVNRYGNDDQGEIMGQVGTALGAELRKLNNYPKEKRISRFCCPLDEALVECILSKPSNNDDDEEGKLINFTLPPYGIYPANIGRTKIGSMETKHVQTFFTNLASSSGLNISLMKIRGDNGHHIVESAFKAFSRALRNLLDGTSTNEYTSTEFMNMWGNTSLSYTSGIELNREGRLERSTKETSILVHVLLNGGGGGGNTASEEEEGKGRGGNVKVHTGVSTVDQFISILATEACMSLEVKCNGDLYVDDHHTSEDVSIALGQVLNVALGTKAGLNRMWCACGKYGDAEVEVTMDLSNRPCMTHDLSLSYNPNNEEYAGDISVEMLDHVLESLVMNSKSTVHIVEKKVGRNVLETALATAMAFGRALRMCSAVDQGELGRLQVVKAPCPCRDYRHRHRIECSIM